MNVSGNDRTQGLENQGPVRANVPSLLFKQVAGSAHRAVVDIKVHFERLQAVRNEPVATRVNNRQSPAKSTRGDPECARSPNDRQ